MIYIGKALMIFNKKHVAKDYNNLTRHVFLCEII